MDVPVVTDNVATSDVDASRQEYLAQLWRTHLNLPQLGILDDFFAAGGSSMQVIEMLMTVSDRFGKEIDYAAFLKDPCIRTLDALLEG